MIVIFTGAGLSTASGIPDFRSKGGVWDHFEQGDFTIEAFHRDPAAFWEKRARLIAAMDYLDAKPNAAHDAIADAADKGAVVVTQNVDGLHAAAGTPPERLIELHGNGRRTRCLACDHVEDLEATLARLLPGQAPPCPACASPLKPDVVLFGEQVPKMWDALQALQGASHLLVVGTSLQVHPAAGLVGHALQSDIPVTICNRDATPYDGMCTVVRGEVVETVPRTLAKLRVQ